MHGKPSFLVSADHVASADLVASGDGMASADRVGKKVVGTCPPPNCAHGCKCYENGMFSVGLFSVRLSENAYLPLGVSKNFWNHPNDTPVYDILKILLPRPNRKKWQNANSIGDV